ncbi:DUF805 domain-containing protein [Pseudomonas sp. LPB0260]|uniref:DUF805 domain-containing protein n=1 Tax=Pseudomonas sp. LPB0260 TaxID=2614442 RepID=UPI0015C28CB1|nr:DUF805 domain-containing protein [Pseudomonas sp. LPB0260]QLC72592.1 DUF805 domain-containing protein [Pseudomonas sp. LPB0260]QLC75366.1 DUF805 domain-containing protein [Pseudomonas sp. LPB0260]
MTQTRFKIVFDGELMPEVALETAKDNLARLFKSDRTRINSLFCGSTVAIKRDLPESDADQYLAALHRAGAKARKEPDPGASLSLLAGKEAEELGETPQFAATMVCPKCGQQQRKSASCAGCGIIITKFVAHQAVFSQADTGSSGHAAAPANSPYATPKAAVAATLPRYGELNVFSLEGRIGRLRYLAWSLVLSLCVAGIMGVVAIAANISETLGLVLAVSVVLGTLVVSVQIGAQRLHDIGWSAWLLLLNLLPLVNSLFWLVLLIVPGSAGANRYGPPPPANSLAVKLLAGLFLALLLGGLLILFLGGFAMLGLALSGLELNPAQP